MYAECPHCHAIFRVTEEILARAGGKVRCGECRVVFEVVDDRRGESNDPPTDETLIPTTRAETDEDDIEVVPAGPTIAPAEAASPVTLPTSFEPEPAEPVVEPAPVEPQSEDFELIIEEREPTGADEGSDRWRRWTWVAVAVLLALLLAQLVVAKRNAIVAAVPALRPVVVGLCKIGGCVVDPRRDVSKIQLASHSVASHPQKEGALLIYANILNNAGFPQPYPIIELTLSDIKGRPVALRRFAPDEYLPPDEGVPAQMTPGRTIPVQIEVLDPGKNALAFEFEFL